MSYVPIIHPVQLTEDDVSELKALSERIEQDEFAHRGTRITNDTRQREHLKACLNRILKQIPRA